MLKAVVADDSENVLVLDLKPKCSNKIADFHIGSPVNSILFPIKLKDPEISFLDFQ
jgi:hypothetical protein